MNDNLASHNHDSRYYTEAEIDTKIKSKQDIGWRAVGSVTGAKAISFESLKSGKSELSLQVSYGSSRSELIIPIPSNTSNVYIPLPGYYINSKDNLTVSVAVSNKIVTLNTYIFNGNTLTNSAKLSVAIR